MEVNKDEAIRCLDLAEQYFTSGDTEKAYKFAKKSEKLFSTKRASDLLDRIMQRKKQSEPTTSAPKDAADNSQTSSKPAEKAVVAEYTKEQLIQVQRIKKCKDYYEILGVAKEATDVEIKKAYKRLALQLHPDKNRAPGSSEAFKAIGNAVAILTDSDKRRKYDLHGNNDDERVTHRNNRTYEYTRGFESDVSAEELFNMFFGNGFASSNHVFMRRSHHQRRARYSDEQTQEQSASQVVIQLLPIIFLLLVSVFSGIFQSDPIYSLTKNSKYSEQQHTTNLKIAYFVPRNFAKTYTGSKDELDKAVEDDFLSYLKHACYREVNERDQLRWKARYFGDKRLYEKANSLATPSCTEFKKYTGILLR